MLQFRPPVVLSFASPRHSARITYARMTSSKNILDRFIGRTDIWNHRHLHRLNGCSHNDIINEKEDPLLHSIQYEMETLEQDIYNLHNKTPFNLASPKQVANVIYGPVLPQNPATKMEMSRSISQKSLENLLQCPDWMNTNDPQKKQELVRKILQWRSLYNMQKRHSFSTTSTSTLNDVASSKKSNHDVPPTTVATSSSTILQPSHMNVQKLDKCPLEMHIDSLFSNVTSESQMNDYWKPFLLQVDKPSAKKIIYQLYPHCPMGYDPNASPQNNPSSSSSSSSSTMDKANTAGKKGSLLSYVRDQKRRFSDAILLVRVGEFYEAFGIDAIALMQCCGLNPMGGKARAGCPIKNIQATLDGLTTHGFRVAIYEEATDTDSMNGPGASAGSKSRLKTRMFAQMVSSASPTYMYDLVLEDSGDLLSQSHFGGNFDVGPRCHVGVIHTAAGYTMVEISSEERSVRVSERFTSEAVACQLAAHPPADPLFYVPASGEIKHCTSNLPFLPSRSDAASDGPGSNLRVQYIPGGFDLMQNPSPGTTDADRARKTIVRALLKLDDLDNKESPLSEEDFVVIGNHANAYQDRTYTKPLHMDTAIQLGLMSDPNIPSIIKALLPESAPVATRRFLRRWLLTPPPPHVADAMATLLEQLMSESLPIPPLTVPPVGKVMSLIRAGQASAHVFREILASIDATIAVMETYGNNSKSNSGIIPPLLTLLKHESGLAAEPTSLLSRCSKTKHMIHSVICINNNHDNNNLDCVSDVGIIIPRAFFERNEIPWRGRIQRKAAKDAYDQVDRAVEVLANAVAQDFWGLEEYSQNLNHAKESKSPIVQDIFNNRFARKQKPSWTPTNEINEPYFHPRDRNGKLQRNRFTTEKVEMALTNYIEASDYACKEVKRVLTKLSQTLCNTGQLPTLCQAAHFNLILSTTVHHASRAKMMKWNMVHTHDYMNGNEMEKDIQNTSAGFFQNTWPYWMDESDAVKNTFELSGLFLLTAPNMSGKSTLMRSTAAAALLINCGLCAPLETGSKLRRFDSLFVRGASADVPTEGKSAFGAEMESISSLMRSCGKLSLVFVDELGRGTSPKDGTIIAGAILEEMAEKRMSGIFATHLHQILDLPFGENVVQWIRRKRMAILGSIEHKGIEWTYRLEDGVCTESLALVTAANFGLSGKILQRAKELALAIPESEIISSNKDSQSEFFNDLKKMEHKMIKNEPKVNEANSLVDKSGLNLDDAIRFIGDILKSNTKVVRIPPSWMPPSSLEGCTCVYILEIRSANANAIVKENENRGSPFVRYYVGETDSFARRLQQHRAKGSDWAQLAAAVVPVAGGKSEARHIESLMIRKMAKSGFDMISVTDGQTIRANQYKT